MSIIAAEWGTGQVFWSMLWFFLFFIWIWLLITVFADIFRSHDMGGFAKFLWVIFVIFLPYLGVFVYLIVNSDDMATRDARSAGEAQQQFDSYVKSVASEGGPSAEIGKAKELLDSGAITQAEFEAIKAKALA